MASRFRLHPFWIPFFVVVLVVVIPLMRDFGLSNSTVNHDPVFFRSSENTSWLAAESYRAVLDPAAPVEGETIFRYVSGTLAMVYQDPTGQVWAIVNTELPTAVVDGNQVLQGEPLVAAIQLTSLWEFSFPDDSAVWIDDGSITRKGRFLSGRIILENP